MNRTIYFPAVGAGTQAQALNIGATHMKNKKSFRFYKDDAIFKHDAMLISAGHQYKKSTKTKWDYDISNPEKFIVLGDSGGYQIASGALDFTKDMVENIFNWLENNTNYAINLDIPPYISINTKKTGVFEKTLNMSVPNFKYFKEHASGKTKYLNVLHGRKPEELNLWYDNVKDFEFEGGWAIGSASHHIYYIMQSFFCLLQNGEIDRLNNQNSFIHILGFSKLKQLYILLYMQHKLNQLGYNINITYDSSSPFMQAAFGGYYMFLRKEGTSALTISNNIIKEKKKILLESDLPCRCPVCKNLTFKDLFSLTTEKGFLSEFYFIVMWHNLYKLVEFKENMENLIYTGSYDLYESIFSKDDLNILKIVDRCFEEEKPMDYLLTQKNKIANLTGEKKLGKKVLY